jgi:hypothetical protein
MKLTNNIFRYSGVEASFNSKSAWVYLDIASALDESSGVDSIVLGKSKVITYLVDDFPGLEIGSSGYVDGNQYTIRDIRLIDDGKIARGYLADKVV